MASSKLRKLHWFFLYMSIISFLDNHVVGIFTQLLPCPIHIPRWPIALIVAQIFQSEALEMLTPLLLNAGNGVAMTIAVGYLLFGFAKILSGLAEVIRAFKSSPV